MKRTLYHLGFAEIRQPDLTVGRKNADFGQGFYLSTDEAFSLRWATERKGSYTYLNTYILEDSGLTEHVFEQDEAWYGYIFSNRHSQKDTLPSDMITGPIANDTLFDTWGILTSGLLSPGEALSLLRVGPCFTQTVIKTHKAASQLTWVSSRILGAEEIGRHRTEFLTEQTAYQTAFAEAMQKL